MRMPSRKDVLPFVLFGSLFLDAENDDPPTRVQECIHAFFNSSPGNAVRGHRLDLKRVGFQFLEPALPDQFRQLVQSAFDDCQFHERFSLSIPFNSREFRAERSRFVL